jgi:preprotein translocase subunit YajC
MIFATLSSLLQAQKGAAPQGGPMWGMPVMMVAIFAIFYLLIIMPQRKKQKRHMELVENLKPGDKIVTSAGIFGKVVSVQKDRIELKIAANVQIEITKSAVGVILGAADKPEAV